MNILVITNTDKSVNGYGTVCNGLVTNFRKKKNVKVDILTSNNSNWKKLCSLKSEIYLKLGMFGFIATIYDIFLIIICSVMKRKSYDVILCVVEHYALPTRIASYLLGAKLVVICHGTYAVYLPHKSRLYKWAFESAELLVAVSEYTRKRLIEENIRSKSIVIKNGVDKSKFVTSESNDAREGLLFVGNLKRRKGFDFVLRSVAIFQKRFDKKIKINFVGKVPKNSEIFIKTNNEIERLGVDVEFHGMVDERELIKLYRASLINVLPSKSEKFFFEGFGLIHLEAAACGCLSVGTFNSGNECAINEVNGFLIDYMDVDQLANVINIVKSYKIYPDLDRDIIDDWSTVADNYLFQLKKINDGIE